MGSDLTLTRSLSVTLTLTLTLSLALTLTLALFPTLTSDVIQRLRFLAKLNLLPAMFGSVSIWLGLGLG